MKIINKMTMVILPMLIMVACTSTDIVPLPVSSENEIEDEPLPLITEDTAHPTPDQITETPQIAQTEVSSLVTDSLCFVFISERAEQLGGMPVSMENFYLSNDGTIQYSQETNDDFILTLRQSTGNTLDILQQLELMEFLTEDSQSSDPANQGLIVTEYYGPTVTFEMVDCDGSSRRVIFPVNEIPEEVERILLTIRQLAETGPLVRLSRGQQFIRSQKLSSEKAEQLRDAALVVDIDNQQLTSSPCIEEGIAHERRLISASSQNLYGSIPLSFVHGRSGHISINQEVFQIRHLLVK
jgi:hypothetical protein